MADPEVLRIIEEYTKITNKFVKEHPFSSLDELKVIVHGPTGVGFLPQETAQRCLSVLNNRYYPHLKRIYDTAGNDASVTKDAGREISKIGGFAAMQGAFYVLANYPPLSIAGRMTEDMEQAAWLYNSIQKDWDGIGQWST